MSLITDISTVTTIPINTLDKLVTKEQLCILHRVYENELKGELITSIDLGIGTLYINHENDTIKYKFIPSRSFESELVDTIKNNKSPLISKVEDALKDKITNTYKDLF